MSNVTQQFMSGAIYAADLDQKARFDFEALAFFIETNEEIENIIGSAAKSSWPRMIRDWLSGKEIDALDIDKLELAREFFTNPEFRRATEEYAWKKNRK